MKKHTGGYQGPRHTEEQIEWARKVIKRLNGKVYPSCVEDSNLVKEYTRLFNLPCTTKGLSSWLTCVKKRDLGEMKVKKKDTSEKLKVMRCLESSKYVLYVFNEDIFLFILLFDIPDSTRFIIQLLICE